MNKVQALQFRKLLEKQKLFLTDKEALEVATFVPRRKENTNYAIDDRVSVIENDNVVLYKCIQTHTLQIAWKPSIHTASLWARIDIEHTGTIYDPIPYDGNMALENGKYYTQDNVLYLCNRDSLNPVYNALSELVGLYIEVVE